MGKKKKNNNKIQGEIQNKIQAEIQNDSNDEPQKDDQNDDNDINNDGGKKEYFGYITVVLKVDMHCEGCETKIKKCVRSFPGVECVKGSNDGSNKLTVIGTKVDPVKLREWLEKKTKKKVELVSPQPKKDKDGGGGGEKKKKNGDSEKKTDKDKFIDVPVTTAVMKLNLHCEGCIQKLRKAVATTKGYHDMWIDKQKDQMTVKGAIDMKALAEKLKAKLKKPVEIVPPKKEKDGGGGEKKEKGGEKGGGGQVEEIWTHYVQYGYPNNQQYVNGYGAGYYQIELLFTPQIFSDENPNACSVM